MARSDPNPREFLWDNITALMQPDGRVSVDSVHRRITQGANSDKPMGRGTVQRIKAGETSVGIETLQEIADAFDISVWQLLVPGLEPKRLPRLQTELSAEAIHIAMEFDRIKTQEGRDKARAMCLFAISQESPGAPSADDEGQGDQSQPERHDAPTKSRPQASKTLT